jgi:hypothetical protein
MKSQMPAIDSKTSQVTEPDRQTEMDSNYPGANKKALKTANYSSMASQIQKISDPVGFEDLKSFYIQIATKPLDISKQDCLFRQHHLWLPLIIYNHLFNIRV